MRARSRALNAWSEAVSRFSGLHGLCRMVVRAGRRWPQADHAPGVCGEEFHGSPVAERVSAPASPQHAQTPEARSITSRRRACHPSRSAWRRTRLGDGEVAVVGPGPVLRVVMAARAPLRRRRRSIRSVADRSMVSITPYTAGHRHFPATGIGATAGATAGGRGRRRRCLAGYGLRCRCAYEVICRVGSRRVVAS
jgi:hypothetical protein